MRLLSIALATIVGSATVMAQEEPPGLPLRIEVTTPAGEVAAGPPHGRLELVPVTGEGEALELELVGTGSYDAAVPTESMWRVRARAAGYWSAEEVAVAGARPAVVALFPSGELRGTLSLPVNVRPPGELRLTFGPSAESRRRGHHGPKGRVTCPVDEQGWRCTLPAGVFDLRLHSPGFASALIWDATVVAGKSRSAPAVSLVPGAAILGRVEIDGEARVEGVEVELVPAGGAIGYHPRSERLGQLERTARADSRGFFQFRDLIAGAYRVEARHPGRAPAAIEPVEVIEGRETDLVRPLVLAPPSELTVFVEPPVPPTARRVWEVELYALDGSNQSRRIPADWTGRAELEMAPGWYRLTVEDARSTWVAEEIEIPAGQTVKSFELPIVAVEGTVRMGGRRVQARLDFGGKSPRSEVVSILTNPEGDFSGHLPGEGEWPLTVFLRPGGSEQRLEPVDVVKRPGEDVARLDLELPKTALLGRVVDSAGEPVARASVFAWPKESGIGRSTGRSDELGRFRFWALAPGEWTVEAFATPRSGRIVVDLEEGEPQRVEIRLSDERVLAGRVSSDWGPVAGALVYAVPEVPRTTPLAPTRSDPLGAFDVRVPADATGVHLLVLALGRSAQLSRVPLPAEPDEIPEIEVTLQAAAGTLLLEVPPPGSGLVELTRGPARVPVTLLRDWARSHGTRVPAGGLWKIDGMEPGAWALCRADECDRGFLLPGGELELSLTPNAATTTPPGSLSDIMD